MENKVQTLSVATPDRKLTIKLPAADCNRLFVAAGGGISHYIPKLDRLEPRSKHEAVRQDFAA